MNKSFLNDWPVFTNQDILILLKLVSAKANGRNLFSVLSFNKATEKLFVFRKVSTEMFYYNRKMLKITGFFQNFLALTDLPEAKNDHPYIIACGESQNKISIALLH